MGEHWRIWGDGLRVEIRSMHHRTIASGVLRKDAEKIVRDHTAALAASAEREALVKAIRGVAGVLECGANLFESGEIRGVGWVREAAIQLRQLAAPPATTEAPDGRHTHTVTYDGHTFVEHLDGDKVTRTDTRAETPGLTPIDFGPGND